MDEQNWGTPEQAPSEITMEQMDSLVKQIAESREKYEVAKEAASALHGDVKSAEAKMIQALKALGRSGYECEGVAKVSFYVKETYTTPKTNGDKTALFNYIQSKYGDDALTSMLSINHNTLGSWANKETESGDVMQIPGLGQPSMVEVLSVRGSK